MASDVLILGGGIIGLAIALELRLQGASVTVISRSLTEAATQAAAGMLAPQAEQTPPGPMLDLCLRSRNRYPDWISKLEALTGLETGYWPCGILAPEFDSASSPPADPPSSLPALYLDRPTLHRRHPGLSPEVAGGWWYSQDGQVDNRLLATALLAAGRDRGVDVHEGTVERVLTQGDRAIGVQTSAGELRAEHYVLATGAWSQALLPIPITPRKGQMLAVQVSPEAIDPLPLQTVLFGSEIYIVPRRDGRIVIGATSEDVGFTAHNTAAGIQALLSRALRLYPGLQDFALQECWWGFRPATPDELPILGPSPYENLTLATGHYRNGILLTPITAALIADWVLRGKADPLLPHFNWQRFQPLSAPKKTEFPGME